MAQDLMDAVAEALAQETARALNTTGPVPNRVQFVREAAVLWPRDFAEAGKHGHPNQHGFVKRLVPFMNKRAADEGAPDAGRWGLNGKRGSEHDLSDDSICYRDAGIALDRGTGRPIEIIDVINAAGGPHPSVHWAPGLAGPGDIGRWIDGGSGESPVPTPQPPAPPTPNRPSPNPRPFVVNREEFMRVGEKLDLFYRSQDGLQRPNGIAGDWEGIAAWLFDVYLMARHDGKTADAAWALVVSNIQSSHEWRSKHGQL